MLVATCTYTVIIDTKHSQENKTEQFLCGFYEELTNITNLTKNKYLQD